jgi:tetratricopeptide (TPR) repeat protein
MRWMLLLLVPASLPAADQWIRLTTPHFEMYTTAGENRAREALRYFEQVRSFFVQSSGAPSEPDARVRIIAFRGEKQYRPYRINEFATAFYTGNADRDYIVMQEISSLQYPVAIHEYTHLIIRHSGLKLPVWLNEGWADLYSTLRPMDGRVRIGDLQPERLRTLARNPWLPLQVLTSINAASPYYNDRDKAGIFYAQSWALMHMLYFDSRYRGNFNRLVAELAVGTGFADACRTVLAVSMEEVEQDLRSYFASRRINAALVDVEIEKPGKGDHTAAAPLSDFDSRVVLADMLVYARKISEAGEELRVLAAENPTRPEVEESLGYMAWLDHDNRTAREHFEKAVALGTKDPKVCYHYAMMEHSAKRVDALQRAVELKPDFMDAWVQLGLGLLAQRNYVAALTALNHVTNVREEQASKVFSARAWALAGVGRWDDARKNALDAGRWAKTRSDAETAATVLRYVARLEPK